MLRARLRCQSKSQERLISHGRLAFCTATKILPAFIQVGLLAAPIVHPESRRMKKGFFGGSLSLLL